MADNKQYITQVQENGNVLISEDVIASIVANAVSEVEGIVGLSVKPGSDIAEKIGKKAWAKGIKIAISNENELSIDCNVNIGYGESVVAVAKAVQEAVSSAIESTAGVKVTSVNINVCGIIRQ
ncbi:MAG: Asp23/Gls24 family envelope stress response protein [Oscillospiraceae bacterium]|nr:Asp23/Gls24 family envelope stress response protein [Oscillospiraceae bacterium]